MESEEWTALGEYIERIGSAKVTELLGLETVTEGWEDLGVKDAVHSYRKATESGLYYIKGVGDMAFAPQTVFELTRDYNRKKQWDQMFMDGRVVHEFNAHSRVLYEQFSAPWPVTNRDFLFATHTQEAADLIVSAGFSVEHPSVPQTKGFVRAHMEIGGFVFRSLGNGQTRVTYTLFMDPRGSIPQMVVNSTQKKQTQNVSKIRAFLTKSS
jgi:hypothetical protein